MVRREVARTSDVLGEERHLPILSRVACTKTSGINGPIAGTGFPDEATASRLVKVARLERA